jgi:hypothetical protein
MAARVKVRLENGFQNLKHRLLDPTINYVGNSEPSSTSVRLGNPNPTDVSGQVGLIQQSTTKLWEDSVFLTIDFFYTLPVDSRGTLVLHDFL